MAPPRPFAIRALAFAAPLLLFVHASTVTQRSNAAPDRTITQVVKLLQGMLDTSKGEATTERDLYAKFKCFVDTNEATKRDLIESLTKEIGLLENDIEKLLASTEMDSKKLAEVKQEIAKTKEDRLAATTLRGTENTAFTTLEADLDAAIIQMNDAITALSDIGADQNMQSSQGHDQYMAGVTGAAANSPLDMPSLVAFGNQVHKAVIAAASLASDSQKQVLQSFLEVKSPFTGTYSAQSGAVVGILKQMRVTFKANRADAQETERKSLAAYNLYMGVTSKKLTALGTEEGTLQSSISGNDSSLSTKRGQLSTAQSSKSDAELFLDQLLTEFARKKKQYGERVDLRMQEQTALAEAIAILNSDSAFTTFSTVDATNFLQKRPLQFLQHASIRRHQAEDDTREKTQRLLRGAANKQHAPLLGRIAAMLQANNPFETVLKEIQKMIDLIAAEETADDDQKSWCDTTRTETDLAVTNAGLEITRLDLAINGLVGDISNPTTGLEFQISAEETNLQTLRDNAATATDTRQQENVAYQKDIANLVDASALVKRAIVVLRNYYSKIDASISAGLLQVTPAPPQFTTTWNDKYDGQSTAAGSGAGGGVIGQLETILTNTQAEETQAHTDEVLAQGTFETDMTTFRTSEGTAVTNLATLRSSLAQKKEELRDRRKEHDTTSKEKGALETYLEKIKPGCDFITTNIATRKTNRLDEKTALEEASRIIKTSPVYNTAVELTHNESLGSCLGICTEGTCNEACAPCKACLNKVSVPGWCASNPTTPGCPTR